MGWTNRQWDDWVRGQPGTFWGEEARRLTKQPGVGEPFLSGSTARPPASRGEPGPVGVLLFVFVGVSFVAGFGAWLLGHPEPVEIGLATGVFALRLIGTVVALLAMQAWALSNEIWLLLSWVSSLGLLGWFAQQSASTLAVLAAAALGVAFIGARVSRWFTSEAPKAVRSGVLIVAGGLILLLWLPLHIELTAQGWQALHLHVPWLMVV